jgi:hypothetical protein
VKWILLSVVLATLLLLTESCSLKVTYTTAPAAPPPVYKPRILPAPSGSYLVTEGAPWSGWTLTFDPDGTLADCQSGHSTTVTYTGKWGYAAGRVHFAEGVRPGPRWKVEAKVLPDGLEGFYGTSDGPPVTPIRIHWRHLK